MTTAVYLFLSASKGFIRKSKGKKYLEMTLILSRPTTKYSHDAPIKARGFQNFSDFMRQKKRSPHQGRKFILRHTSPMRVVDLSDHAHAVLNQHTHRDFVVLGLLLFQAARKRKQERSFLVKQVV
jgi:hypothetical protein